MKKRTRKVCLCILTGLMVTVTALAIASCVPDQNGGDHVHEWGSYESVDEEHHCRTCMTCFETEVEYCEYKDYKWHTTQDTYDKMNQLSACLKCGEPSVYYKRYVFEKNEDGKSYTLYRDARFRNKEVNFSPPAYFLGLPVTVVGKEIGREKVTTRFPDNTVLKTVTLPETVRALGDHAFSNPNYKFPALEKVTLNQGIREIGVSAFNGCSGLAEINFPFSLKKISGLAFEDCSLLTECMIPNGQTVVEDHTFLNCSSLTEVNLPVSVTEIESEAFRGCTSLRRITGLEHVTTFGGSAFYGTAFTEIEFSDEISEIGEAAFYGASLTEVVLPDSVKSIGAYAFRACKSLRRAVLPAHLETLDVMCFSDCTALTDVVIPNSLTRTLAECPGNPFYNTPWYSMQPIGPVSIGHFMIGFGGDCPDGYVLDTIGEEVTQIVDGPVNREGRFGVYLPDHIEWVAQGAFFQFRSVSAVISQWVKAIHANAFKNATVYTDAETIPAAWGTYEYGVREQPFYAVVGCELSPRGEYVVSFEKQENSVTPPRYRLANYPIADPMRSGYTFGGWTSKMGSMTAEYTTETMNTAPNGTRLFAIWIKN